MSLQVGKSYFLDNKEYTILKDLPSGTFKIVYLALDKHSDHKVVIAESSNPENKLLESVKFKRMMKYLQTKDGQIECNKRIICPVAIIEDGRYIITNYFDGSDLFDFIGSYIKSKKFIPFDHVVKIMINCIDALSDLHNTLYFAHLDLKPENIMINKNLEIGLIDIGEGCSLDDITTDCAFGETKGTEGYMSPEIMFHIDQVQKSTELMKASDIYSLGCVFYELLYLRRPFDSLYERGLGVREGIKKMTKRGLNYFDIYNFNKSRNPSLIGRPLGNFTGKSKDPILLKLDKIVTRMLEPNSKNRIDLETLRKELDLIIVPEGTFTDASSGTDVSKATTGTDVPKAKVTGRTARGLKRTTAFEDLSSLMESISETPSGETISVQKGSGPGTLPPTDSVGKGTLPPTGIFTLISEKNHQSLQKLLNIKPLDMYEFYKTDFRFTPVEWAVENDCKECIEVILKTYDLFKDDSILRFNSDIRSLGQPLHLAVRKKNRNLVHFLITNKFGINKFNKMGYTPLHVAVLQNSLQMVQLLIRYSAKIEIYSKDDQTPLKLALDNKYFDIARVLIQNGADIEEDVSIDQQDYLDDPEISDFLARLDVKSYRKKKRLKLESEQLADKRYRKMLYKKMCENLSEAINPRIITKVSRELRTDISGMNKKQICDRLLRNVLFKNLIIDD